MKSWASANRGVFGFEHTQSLTKEPLVYLLIWSIIIIYFIAWSATVDTTQTTNELHYAVTL